MKDYVDNLIRAHCMQVKLNELGRSFKAKGRPWRVLCKLEIGGGLRRRKCLRQRVREYASNKVILN